MNKNFSFLQISDLHIFNSSLDILQKDDFKKLGEEMKPSFIVVSGDFRSLNGDSKFDHAKEFLEETVLPTFNLGKEHVFFVPGNHDVSIVDGDAKIENEKIKEILDGLNNSNPDINDNDIVYLKKRFEEYESFVKDFYKGSGVDDKRIINPSEVYTYNISNALRLIFVNTSLASCNRAFGNESELIDLKALSSLIEKEDNSIPSIIVGHHSVDHIYIDQRRYIIEVCQRLNVRAWLCGDEHLERVDETGIQAFGDRDIPILVMGKTPIQAGDSYSNNSIVLYSYSADNKTLQPTVYTYNTKNGSAIGYHKSIEFRDRNDEPIKIDMSKKKEKTRENARDYKMMNPKNLIDEYKKEIKNECIIPWAYKSYMSFDAVFPKLFIKPSFNSLKKLQHYYTIDNIIKENCNNHIVITGDAGAGKSTFLKNIFLCKNILPNNFLYITASYLAKAEICETDKQYQYIQYVKNIIEEKDERNTIILIDAIDEGFKDDIDKLDDLLKKVKKLKHTKVWFGWRKEHYYHFKNDLLQKLISEEINIGEWTVEKAKKYVKKYSEYSKYKKLNDYFLKCVEKSDNVLNFSKNPFQLTLLVYLIENKHNKLYNSLSNISVYNLYDNFIELWIDKEAKETDKSEIISELTRIAKEIYYEDKAEVNDTKLSVIRDLLHFSSADYADEFCHRSLAAYFVAREILGYMNSGGEELARVLCKTLKSDITGFIKSATLDNDDECILNMQQNLMNLYNPNGNNELLDKYKDEERFCIKNEVVYLVTRLRRVGNEREKYIREVNDIETDIRMRVTIAYGAATLGLQDMVLSFAKEFYDEKSNLAHATRSFSLIYYGDVSKGSMYSYQDKGTESWTKSREIRVKNLKSNEEKYIFFRILDIPLLYSFYASRKWKDVTYKGYYSICRSKIDSELYTKEVRVFLNEKKNLFKLDYKKHLFPLKK